MTRQLSFPVTGLNCASCALRAETALRDVNGVDQAEVNFATRRAEVTTQDSVTAQSLSDALEKAGKPAQQQSFEFSVTGLNCGSCVSRVESAIGALDGVLTPQVNLATGTAKVTGLGLDPRAVIAAIQETGREARLLTPDTEAAPRPSEVQDQHAAEMYRAFLIAACLTLPVFNLEMGGHAFPAFHHWIMRTIGMQTSWMIQFALTFAVILWPGRELWRSGLRALWRRQPDMDALVVLGSGAAFAYSSVALFAPSVLPETSRAVYFEAAAVIITLILAGRWLEARAKGKTGSAIESLLALRPASALTERDGTRQERPIAEIIPGEVIHLRPGERVAVDGVVTGGDSWVDESMLTGEPVPVHKVAGDTISAGTMNGTGSLVYQARAVGADTVLGQIIHMVQSAQSARLPVQNLVNQVTAWFVPAVLFLALCTVAIWLVFGPEPALNHALVAGVSVLIIACPCAMGLATPTSIMVGTGRAAELGVLFAKGAALQELNAVKVVAFDKTGTLTEGNPSLTDIEVFSSLSAPECLTLAAAAETQSEHPIAQAIVRAAQEQKLASQPVTSFDSITGGGVQARIDQHNILMGNARLLRSQGVVLDALTQTALGTEVLLAVDGLLAARFVISDPVKPNSASAIAALKSMGLIPVMLTGDSASAAEPVAKTLGIAHVLSDLKPGDKDSSIAELKTQYGGKVAFVGDGINDAPALARADVGIAIGTGTDVAIEAADVVLRSGDPKTVQSAFAISSATLRNIRQNLFWAFGYNALLIPVAAGALYPAFGVMLSPALAAGAMALSSVFVVSNALRLRRAAG